MNKDTVVASIIGFGLGLIAAIAIWVAPHILPKRSNTVNSPVVTDTASEEKPIEATILTINTPLDGEIAKSKEIEVKGKSQNTMVVSVSTSDETTIAHLGQDGEFSVKIVLTDGANEIDVTSISPTKQEHQQLFVYYISEN